MTYPVTIGVTFDFSDGATFGYPLILDDAKNGQIGNNYLGTAVPQIVDISNQVGKISIKGGYNLLQDQFQTATLSLRLYDPTGAWNPTSVSSPYYPKLVPLRKIRVSGTYAGKTQYLFSGYVTAYNYSYTKDQNAVAYVDIDASDGFKLLQLANITTVTGAVSGQDTGTRINAILDQVSWPNGLREITTGGSEAICQADPGTARTALQAIKNAEFTEQGAFYMDGEGDAIFKSRAYVMATSGQNPTYFSNANDGGIAYFGIKFALDDKLIINDATINNVAGTAQRATDAASTTTYFPHSRNQTDLVGLTDSNSLNIAKNYVATRANTSIRIDSITLDLSTTTSAGTTAALALDYFNTMRIKNIGQNGTVIDKTLQCVGMAYEITPQTFYATFTTSEPIVGSFILNSSIYGVIGDPAGLSILGY
jgi:hypothetical protein